MFRSKIQLIRSLANLGRFTLNMDEVDTMDKLQEPMDRHWVELDRPEDSRRHLLDKMVVEHSRVLGKTPMPGSLVQQRNLVQPSNLAPKGNQVPQGNQVLHKTPLVEE